MKKSEKENNSNSVQERLHRTQRLILSAQNSLLSAEKALRDLKRNPLPNKFLHQEAVTQAESTVLLIEDRIAYLENESILIREINPADVEYRKDLVDTLPEQAKRRAIRNKKLRFHGATLVSSLRIIANGSISSSQERGMGQVSFDGSGQISVTDLKSISLSIKDYTGIKDQFIPLGCLFVVLPQNRADERTISSYLMRSLKLKERKVSKRFVAVLCSPESLPIIKKQLQENGYPPTLAKDYFEFLESLK